VDVVLLLGEDVTIRVVAERSAAPRCPFPWTGRRVRQVSHSAAGQLGLIDDVNPIWPHPDGRIPVNVATPEVRSCEWV